MSNNFISEKELELVAKNYEDELKTYMSYQYPITLSKIEESGLFIAILEDLPGCEGYGYTPEEAIRDIEESKRNWFLMSFRKGVFPPKPKEIAKLDRILLRIPRELHVSLGKFAAQNQVSFNSFVTQILHSWLKKKWLLSYNESEIFPLSEVKYAEEKEWSRAA